MTATARIRTKSEVKGDAPSEYDRERDFHSYLWRITGHGYENEIFRVR